MTTQRNITPKSQRKSSRPEGWLPAGAKVPIRLTVRQEKYCRRAIGISRFCYNLAVATHRFHRINRLPWPSWQDIYKAFNACKREDYPFVTEARQPRGRGRLHGLRQSHRELEEPQHQDQSP